MNSIAVRVIVAELEGISESSFLFKRKDRERHYAVMDY